MYFILGYLLLGSILSSITIAVMNDLVSNGIAQEEGFSESEIDLFKQNKVAIFIICVIIGLPILLAKVIKMVFK